MYKVGQKIKIIKMEHQDHYNGRVGVITEVDNHFKQLRGTWGAMAVLTDKDAIEIIE